MISETLLKTALDAAKTAGADDVEVIASSGQTLEATVRNGTLENVERAEGRDIGIRVFLNGAQASASGSDITAAGITTLAERVVAMAKVAPPDPYCGFADKELWGKQQDLDLIDNTDADAKTLEDMAKAAEDAALSHKGITNSFGAGASSSRNMLQILTSHGLRHDIPSTAWSCWMTSVAEKDGAMERDHDWSSRRHFADLKDANSIGHESAKRTLARLGARKIPTQTAAVIFDKRCAARIISPALEAIAGPSVARGVSFLKDKMEQPVFAEHFTIIEDPFLKRGQGSSAIDREGVKRKRRHLFDKGTLTTWMMHTASAKQLGLTTTGHASWSVGGAPSVTNTNVWVEKGEHTPEQMMADHKAGLIVTDMFGPSLNRNTGDWSAGANGFWFENGEIAYPVNEITVAGNLHDIYKRIRAASDLEFNERINAPSLLVDDLMIAGQ